MITPSIKFREFIFSCIVESENGVISPLDVYFKIDDLFKSNNFSLSSKDLEPISPKNK